MSLLFLSTMAVAGDATDFGAIINKSMDAVAPVIKEATTSFFKGQKRLNQSCNMRECEAPWICYRKTCQECQTGDEKDLVDGLMCKFPNICMPMPHDKSKKGCINPAEWVNCGGHYAASCKACPGGNDKNYCNGDCEWFDPADSANASKAHPSPISSSKPALADVGPRVENVASGAPVYHTYMSAPPGAVELLPFCRAKATTAPPPANDGKYKIVCSTNNLQECSTDRNCIWVWNGSGLDPAAKLSGTEPVKREPAASTLTKTGQCLVLESYLASSVVRQRKKLNKLAADDLEPDDDGATKLNAICDKHSSRTSDRNRGICETEPDAKCAWWDKRGGGKCVPVDPRDVHADKGGKCFLPFYYAGVKYDGCTEAGVDQEKNKGMAWCSLDMRNESTPSKIFQHSGNGDWDWCTPDAPISAGKKIDEDELDGDFDEQCLSSVHGDLKGKGLDCVGFAASKGKYLKRAYCEKYPVAAAECCRAECVAANHKVQPASPPAPGPGHKVQPASPPAPGPATSSLKQRTTQSFLAADNWE